LELRGLRVRVRNLWTFTNQISEVENLLLSGFFAGMFLDSRLIPFLHRRWLITEPSQNKI